VNTELLRIGIAGVIAAHGIGHVLGWMPALGLARFEGVSSRSWLLTDTFGEVVTRPVAGAIWIGPTVGFVLAAAGMLMGQEWWRPVALGSAAVSLVAVALFWDALPPSSRIGCIAVDVALLGWLAMTALGAGQTAAS